MGVQLLELNRDISLGNFYTLSCEALERGCESKLEPRLIDQMERI